MTAESTSPRIYVACLASYNSGRLHGVHIDAAQDVDDIMEEVRAMLRDSPCPNVQVPDPDSGEMVPSAEEWAIHDYEGFCGIKINEYDSFERVAAIAQALDELTEPEAEAFGIWYNQQSRDYTDDVPGLVEEFREKYQGIHDSEAAYAEQFTEDTGGLEGCPAHLRNYIDYESMAHDWNCNGDIWSERGDHGLHVFTN